MKQLIVVLLLLSSVFVFSEETFLKLSVGMSTEKVIEIYGLPEEQRILETGVLSYSYVIKESYTYIPTEKFYILFQENKLLTIMVLYSEDYIEIMCKKIKTEFGTADYIAGSVAAWLLHDDLKLIIFLVDEGLIVCYGNPDGLPKLQELRGETN